MLSVKSTYTLLFFLLSVMECAASVQDRGHSIPTSFLNSFSGPQWAAAIRYPRSIDHSITTAHNRVSQLLSWERHVRLRGERIFQREADGKLVFKGEHIELVEIDSTGLEVCQIDTVMSAEHVWVSGYCSEVSPTPVVWKTISSKRPEWLSTLPQDEVNAYAIGIATKGYSDTPGSWQLAAYRSLIELGFSVQGAIESAQWSTESSISSARVMRLNVGFRGFRPIARWADETHVYVLGAVPLAGVIK